MCGELMEPDKDLVCFCGRCRAVWENEKEELCPNCRRNASHCICEPKYNRSGTVDGYRSLVFYNGEQIKKLIYSIKTGYDAALYDTAARELALSVMKYCKVDGDSMLAYPERSRASVKKYGIDHGKILCKKVSEYTNIPVFHGLKHRRGAEQKTLKAAERGENAARSYYIKDKDKTKLKGKKIIFIDDVVTTGATTVVCAALCKAEGAAGFSAFSIARTP